MVKQQDNVPCVLLIRSEIFYTTAMYLERALRREYNVISLNVTSDLLNRIRRRLSPKLLAKLLYVSTKDELYYLRKRAVVNPDIILVVDPIRRKFNLNKFNAITAYYAIDSHTAFRSHITNAGVKDYDFLFVAQKDWIPKYKELGCESVHWLPLACDPEIHRRWDLPLRHDLCFLGTLYLKSARNEIISRLRKEFDMFVGKRYLHDMARTYSQSKIIFNKSFGELNMRVFEAMSCGRLLITDRISNGMEDLFIDKKQLVLYDQYDDLVEKIRYYLKNEDERERIALCGQKEAHSYHTYLHRARYIMDAILGKTS